MLEEIMGANASPWDLYDRMIAGIPRGIAVLDYCLGLHWAYVEAESGIGISHTLRGGGSPTLSGDPRDLDLRSLAELSKSWDFIEATLGIAALNAWYSQLSRLEGLGALIDWENQKGSLEGDPFKALREDYSGKNVTVIGHFPHVEQMAEYCNLTVLERNCTSPVDVPDPAAEYIIPEQDYLFMTGTTLQNKTAPRLLELGKNTITVMVGPSTVPCEPIANAGVQVLSGSVVVDAEEAKLAVRGGNKMQWRRGIKKFMLR
ncbi:MAG: hypothetical protein IKE43_13315 [Coriobacteriales bacterium]|nr:hypothetical protein [Coriobacteriales bacterium]